MRRSPPSPGFGERLRQAIHGTGLSVGTFAKEIQVAPSSLYTYVKEGRLPPLDVLTRICKRGKVTYDWLCYGTPETTREIEEPYGPDRETLRKAIADVETAERAAEVLLTPGKKADLVALLYEMMVQGGKVSPDQLLAMVRLAN